MTYRKLQRELREMGCPFDVGDGAPVNRMIDRLWADFHKRHAWLADAAAKIERWKAEDAAAVMPWDESQQGAGDSANNAPGHIR